MFKKKKPAPKLHTVLSSLTFYVKLRSLDKDIVSVNASGQTAKAHLYGKEGSVTLWLPGELVSGTLGANFRVLIQEMPFDYEVPNE